MPLITQQDINSVWTVAECLLEKNQVESAICTLHGLLINHQSHNNNNTNVKNANNNNKSSSNNNNNNNTSTALPVACFESEVLTRLRLAHILLNYTTNQHESARKLLEEILPRFEGSSASLMNQQKHQQQLASSSFMASSNANNASISLSRAEEIFDKKFPFAIQVLKCHVFRLIGISWMNMPSSNSNSNNNSHNSNMLKALSFFRDSAKLCLEVIHHSRLWLKNNDNTATSTSSQQQQQGNDDRRRQRDQDEVGKSNNNNISHNVITLQQKMWKIASLRLATLLLSIRHYEATILYQFANSANVQQTVVDFSLEMTSIVLTSTSTSQTSSASVELEQIKHESLADQLVYFTTKALSQFMSLVAHGNYLARIAKVKKEKVENDDDGADKKIKKEENADDDDDDEDDEKILSSDNNNNNRLLLPEIHLGLLFRSFDKATPNQTTMKKQSEIESKVGFSLTPILASFALFHIYGLLMSPHSSQQKRATDILRKWSVSSSSSSQSNGEFSSKFTHLWRFLLLLSSSSSNNNLSNNYVGDDFDQQQLQQQQLFEQNFLSEDSSSSPENTKRRSTNVIETASTTNSQNNNNNNKSIPRSSRSSRSETLATLQSTINAGSPSNSKSHHHQHQHQNSSASIASGENKKTFQLQDWLSNSVVDIGSAKCAFELVRLIREIQNFVKPTTTSNEKDQEPQHRTDRCLDSLNHLMCLVEEQLKKLTSPAHSLSSSTTKIHAEVKFLVSVKVAAYCEMTLFDLTNLDVVSAITKLDSLRHYVALFKRHTITFRPNIHILIAMVAMYMGMNGGGGGGLPTLKNNNEGDSKNTNSNNNINSKTYMEVLRSHCIEAAKSFAALSATAIHSGNNNNNNLLQHSTEFFESNTEAYVDFVLSRTNNSNNNSNQQSSAVYALSKSIPLLVEVCGIQSFLKANSYNNANNNTSNHEQQQRISIIPLSASDVRNLRQRFNSIVEQVQFLVDELEEQEHAQGNTALSKISSSSLVLFWKLMFAVRCLEDRDAPRALEYLRKVVDACAKEKVHSMRRAGTASKVSSPLASDAAVDGRGSFSRSTSFSSSSFEAPQQQQKRTSFSVDFNATLPLASQNDNQSGLASSSASSPTNNITSASTPIAIQYILATALRLAAIAHSLQCDLSASNAAIAASCRTSGVIEDELSAIHCIAFALQNLLGTGSSSSSSSSEKDDQWKQRELFGQVQTMSNSFGAQIALIESGQLSSVVAALFAFLPKQSADYDKWISSSPSMNNSNGTTSNGNDNNNENNGRGSLLLGRKSY